MAKLNRRLFPVRNFHHKCLNINMDSFFKTNNLHLTHIQEFNDDILVKGPMEFGILEVDRGISGA